MATIDWRNFRCVDDDQSFRVLFENMLRALEISKVTSGRSVADARGIFHTLNHAVDAVFCDFSMENGSGLELLRAIRMGEIKAVKPETCFIMVTASSGSGLVNLATALDVNGFLVKPLSVNKLRSTIQKAMQKEFVAGPKRYAEVVIPGV